MVEVCTTHKNNFILIFFIAFFLKCGINPKIIDTIPTLDPRYKKLIFDQKHGIDSYGNIFGKFTIKKNNKIEKAEFNIYRNNIDNILISIPSDWTLKFEKFLFLAEIDDLGEEFFLILRHKKEDYKMPTKEYLKLVLQELKKDSIELLLNHQAYEIIKNDLTNFLLEGEIRYDTASYLFSSYYLEHNNFLYEISVKYKKSNDSIISRDLFDVICNSIIVDHESLFSKSSSLTKEINFNYR